MTFKLDSEIDLRPHLNCKYIIASQHRKTGNPKKCIWLITRKDEIDCFVYSKQANWQVEYICWGLKLVDSIPQAIGKNPNKEILKIAKFINGNRHDTWHGYPADYLRRSQDIPATKILQIWTNKGYISKSDFRKIRQGMPCGL